MSDNTRQPLLWQLSLARRLFAAGALEPTVKFQRVSGSEGHLVFKTRWGEQGLLAMTRNYRDDDERPRQLSATIARGVLARGFPGARLMSQ